MYGTQNPFEEEEAPRAPPRPARSGGDDEARQPLMSAQPSQPSYLRHSQNLSSGAPAAAPPVPQKDQAAAADMLDRRARELDARERALSRREAEARQLEEDARRAAADAPGPDPRAPNWPPCFPKKLVYQDFEVDIPVEVRPRVKMSYYHVLGLFHSDSKNTKTHTFFTLFFFTHQTHVFKHILARQLWKHLNSWQTTKKTANKQRRGFCSCSTWCVGWR